MTPRNDLVQWLDSYLSICTIEDASLNGLQVEGADEVTKVAFMVDAGLSSFQAAAAFGADMVVVHHGLFWKGADMRLQGVMMKRLRPLLSENMSLYTAHLPLDMHDEVGNNVELLRCVDAKITGGFAAHGSGFIGRVGEVAGQSVQDIQRAYENVLGCASLLIAPHSSKVISKIAVLSGAASRSDLVEAVEKGAELFVTGEQSEWYHDAMDQGIAVLFLGHHASETMGIQALMRVCEKQFPSLDCAYIPHPTHL